MGINTVGGAGNTAGGETASWRADKWSTASWTGNFNVPQELKKQYGEQVSSAEGPVSIDGKGACTVTFQYKGGDKGNNKLNLAGVQLPLFKGPFLTPISTTAAQEIPMPATLTRYRFPPGEITFCATGPRPRANRLPARGKSPFPCPCARWRKSRNPRRTNPGWPRDSGAVKPPCSPGKYGTYPPFSEFCPRPETPLLPGLYGTGTRDALPPLHPL